MHVNIDICVSTLLPPPACSNRVPCNHGDQWCPEAWVVARPHWVRMHDWMTHCLLGAKRALSSLSSTLSNSPSFSSPTLSFSFCTYLHFGISKVNKSQLVSSQTPGGKCCRLTPQRGVGTFCWLASCLIFISTLPFCLVAKKAKCCSIMLWSLVFMESQVR